jgi:hypothetical protein
MTRNFLIHQIIHITSEGFEFERSIWQAQNCCDG